MILGPGARGQDAPGPVRPAIQAPPAPADAMRLYQRLAGWVREWKVPTDAQGEPDVPGLTAVAVTLRHDGAIIGRGIDTTGGVQSLVLASAQAMAEAHARLPIERDALFAENVRAAADRMSISLELAGPRVPISPATWSDATLELAPGIHGVAARHGEQTGAIFPGTMVTSGMDGGRALAAALSKASQDPSLIVKQPAELAREHGVVFYRFRTTHLAQPGPGAPPVFLHRAGRVAESRELTEEELRRWARGLAESLMARRWPGPERYGLQGTYDPVKGAYEGSFAGPAEQSLAALALARYAATAGARDAHHDLAADAARLVLEALAHTEEGEADPAAELASDAAFVAAAGELPWGRDIQPPSPDLYGRALAALHAWADATDARAGTPPPITALAAWALVRDEIAGNLRAIAALPQDAREIPPQEFPRGAPAVRDAFRAVSPPDLVSLMPWAGWADRDLALGAIPAGGAQRDVPLPAAIALRQMRSQCWTHQLRAEDLAFDQRDLAGGIAFTASRNPMPSWQSARPLAFIATMLGDPRLTDPGEVNAELIRLLTSLRFLRQLSAGEAEGHMYANPARAMWGVRAGPWDHRQPLEATAMTLLTVCETLRSLEALKAAR